MVTDLSEGSEKSVVVTKVSLRNPQEDSLHNPLQYSIDATALGYSLYVFILSFSVTRLLAQPDTNELAPVWLQLFITVTSLL